MFRVGQKVVCVDASDQRNRKFPVTKGTIYTIQAIVEALDFMGDGGACAFLCGLGRDVCPIMGKQTPFALRRFRPIVERKTDISIFTEMLRRESAPSPLAEA
jgi:hypothetical protein